MDRESCPAYRADSGKIEAAALDVFREESLPADDPFWKVSATPHAAARRTSGCRLSSSPAKFGVS
ncbi:NAD(P)-dependent oxidoreductase [Mesorhizobium sp.]|uniref:NAD(P)-dependent oxidoreductase n=1 Tax=Mesorhizobium sp. TaxID=1871066 RepID=UPI00343F9D0C